MPSRRTSGHRSGAGRLAASGHKYPRSARLNETLREVIADELVKIDDDRLEEWPSFFTDP